MSDERFGTDPKFLHRRDDQETSKDAAESVDSTKLERMVYDMVCGSDDGLTSYEVLDLMPEQEIQTISPRYAQLVKKDFIYRDGTTRVNPRTRRRQLVMYANRRKAKSHFWVERRVAETESESPHVTIANLRKKVKELEDLLESGNKNVGV